MPARGFSALGAVLLVSVVAVTFGCGGGNASLQPPPFISGPAPVVSSLSPTSTLVGGNGFTLTLNGSNFTSSVAVTWNGGLVPSTFVNSQQITATISSLLIASPGIFSVRVQSDSGGSAPVSFAVDNPTPEIASISPDNAMAGSAPIVVTIIGSGFQPGTYLIINGTDQTPQSQTPTQLQTTIPDNELAAAGSLTISAANLAPTVGPSNQVAFTVTPFTTNPVPALNSVLDPSVPAGWPGFQLHVYGGSFVVGSVLQWNGVNLSTRVISSTELTAPIPAGYVASPATVQVSANNPSPGGGGSSPLSVDVQSVSPDAVGVIDRSDIATDLTEPNGPSAFPAVSGNGRFVAFISSAVNLVPPNIQNEYDEDSLFLRDTCVGAPTGCVPSLTFISVAWDYTPAISQDGRFVAFISDAGLSLYDSCAGVTSGCATSTRTIDANSNGQDGRVSLSADGRFAAFFSGDFDCGYWDYCDNQGRFFVTDTCAGLASGCTPSAQEISPLTGAYIETGAGQLATVHPSISPDGRFVALVTDDVEVALYDSCQGAAPNCSPSTAAVSVASDGSPADGVSYGASVSSGGRYVAFVSSATGLVSGNVTPGVFRVYLRDTCNGVSSGCTRSTTLVAIAGDGMNVVGEPSISADGRYIAFASGESGLVPGDTNGDQDIFVFDTCAGVSSGCSPSTLRVSVALDGTQGNSDSVAPMISGDGQFVVFDSAAKLGPGMPNRQGPDVYLARR